MKALFKPLSAVLLASFLAACSLIPPAQQSSQQSSLRQAQVQTAADTGQKPPEKVTFPNMVKTTPLDTNLPEDKNAQLNQALEQALAEKPAEEGFAVQSFNLPQIFVVRFMAQAKNLKQQVKIPENGEFKLVLEAGSVKKLEILDGDGSDGQATIRLPQHTYEALLHLQGPWKPNSSLEVSDDLYYVKDTLSSKQGKLLDLNRWFLLGVRPLPVPSDWYNPDGQKLVLKFKTDTVKEFQMAWWTTNQQAAYPPGIRQIGPAGGVVELPGVAELEVPAGALNENKIIAIKQKLEVDNMPGAKDVAPPAEFFPDGLQFNKPAYVRLAVDPEKTKGFRPDDVAYLLFPSNTWKSEHLYKAEEGGRGKTVFPDRSSIYDWVQIPHFSYLRAIVMEMFYHEENIRLYGTGQEDIQLAANYRSVCPIQPPTNPNEPLYLITWGDQFHSLPYRVERVTLLCRSLLNSSRDYHALSQPQKPPPRWAPFNYQGQQWRAIRVELYPFNRFDTPLGSGLGSAQVFAHMEGNLTNGVIKIDPSFSVNNAVDTAAHENFHLFQLSNLEQKIEDNFLFNQWRSLFSATDRAWLLESSARFMGTDNVYRHYDDYRQRVPAIESNPISLLYKQLPYGESLKNSLELLQNTSLYTTPNREGDEVDNRYWRLGLFSLISQFYGPSKNPNNPPPGLQKIYYINKDYLKNGRYTNEGSVEAITKHAPIEQTFPIFGTMVAQKNYGLGTENPNNFKKTNGSRLISNNGLYKGTLETVHYTIQPEPNPSVSPKPVNPIFVTTGHTPNKPQTVTNSSLQNLQMAHRYVEFPLVTQIIKDKDPYMAYIYLDRASAEGLTNEQAEDLIAKGTRVLVLKNPKPLDNWMDEKPLLAKVKWLSDPTTPDQPLPPLKFEKRIQIPIQSLNPTIKEVIPRYVYVLGIPIPLEDRPTKNGSDKPHHRVRLILSITNPYITANSDKKTISFQFKAFVSPTIWGKKAFTQTDGIQERKMIALSGSGFSSDNTVVYFKHYKDGIGDIPVKAKSVTFVENPTNAEEEQEILVEVPADAAPESESYIYAKSGTLDSGLKEKLELVCNMLPVGADFRITSEGNCKQSP